MPVRNGSGHGSRASASLRRVSRAVNG